MTFDQIPSANAEGAILAHALAVGGRTFKKGRRLDAADCTELIAAGILSVLGARLGPDDVGEDEAAQRVAVALAGSEVDAAAPFTGRANLYAARAGVLVIDPGRIDAVNRVDEAITVATLRPYAVVEPGDMVGTVKIIPFAVARGALGEAVARAAGAPLSVFPFRAARAGLVLTRLPQTKPSVIEKRIRTTAARLEARGARLQQSETVLHEPEAVAAALCSLDGCGCDPILVFAASAIVDRGDVVPAALVRAGGVVDRLGMPVDPGNLIMVGRLGDRTVIGVPSCAASPKLNGFDWVLERALAGLAIGPGEIAGMGVGGLLGEIASRPQPRQDPGALTSSASDTGSRGEPRIAALVLAAGRSTRMGTADGLSRAKLLEPIGGKAMVRHVVEAALQSRVTKTIVVTGHRGDEVRATLGDLAVAIVPNPRFADGLATSISAGLTALQGLAGDIDGVVVLLGDMPRVSTHIIDRLIAAFSPDDGRAIVVPTHAGQRGNPVLWGRSLFGQLTTLSGDTGGRALIQGHAERVVEVDVGTPAIHLDIDTPEALAAFRERYDQVSADDDPAAVPPENEVMP